MVTSDPSAMINAAICAVIVLVLMFYQREGARHRPLISLTAYFAVLVSTRNEPHQNLNRYQPDYRYVLGGMVWYQQQWKGGNGR